MHDHIAREQFLARSPVHRTIVEIPKRIQKIQDTIELLTEELQKLKAEDADLSGRWGVEMYGELAEALAPAEVPNCFCGFRKGQAEASALISEILRRNGVNLKDFDREMCQTGRTITGRVTLKNEREIEIEGCVHLVMIFTVAGELKEAGEE